MEITSKKRLEQPFDKNVVKTRRGPNGNTLSYVPVGEYVKRLNDVFGADWSFELVDRQLLEDQIVVEGRLSVGKNVKGGIGGSTVTRRRDDGSLVCLADDYKSAASDALKRCCRLLGIGGELYTDDVGGSDARRDQRDDNRPNAPHTSPGTDSEGRVTKSQLQKLEELVAELGVDWRSFRDSVRRRHDVNVEYANRGLASQLIGELITQLRKARSNGGSHHAVDDRRTW